MGKFESRDPRYVAGEICAHKWALGDGDRSSMKKCSLPATVGVPVRIGRFARWSRAPRSTLAAHVAPVFAGGDARVHLRLLGCSVGLGFVFLKTAYLKG